MEATILDDPVTRGRRRVVGRRSESFRNLKAHRVFGGSELTPQRIGAVLPFTESSPN
jgi:hypothetical protein